MTEPKQHFCTDGLVEVRWNRIYGELERCDMIGTCDKHGYPVGLITNPARIWVEI